MKRRAAIALLALGVAAVFSVAPPGAGAVEPDEMLADPVLEARAREISKGLRCLVCQNQSIDESNADLARDVRKIVRQRLTAGDSDDEVVGYIVARYGDWVLLKPPMKLKTYALWYGPVAFALLAIAGVWLFFARRRRAPGQAGPAPLSTEERRRLEGLLGEDEGGGKEGR